jgi:lipopolysaccharide transport system ATP-binding protein
MNDTVIHIDKISKRYKIGERVRYLALRDVMARTLRVPLRLFRKENSSSRTSGDGYFWALKDVCLDIHQGEIVGLIGRNGAGKTTLLKILSRITRPTSGSAEVRGRVGSLLEVGTGFHTELTGRENVYFYGSILGMRKKEIARKFDEIVDFAGVEKFLDTPLKHYSTGMQSRLAFAVAAHLEPEILLVDEVLAVGDLEFQRKCLGKMEKVSQGGRTVVLVSHQLNQIRRLCQKVVWLDNGQVRSAGPAAEVAGAYEAALLSREDSARSQLETAGVKARILRWELADSGNDSPFVLKSLGSVRAKFVIQVNEPLAMVHAGIALVNAENQLMWGTANNISSLEPGLFEFVYDLSSLPLKPGAYRWRITLFDESKLLDVWDCSPDLLIDTEPLGHPDEQWAGLLNIENQFSIYDQAGDWCDIRAPRGRRWSTISFR